MTPKPFLVAPRYVREYLAREIAVCKEDILTRERSIKQSQLAIARERAILLDKAALLVFFEEQQNLLQELVAIEEERSKIPY